MPLTYISLCNFHKSVKVRLCPPCSRREHWSSRNHMVDGQSSQISLCFWALLSPYPGSTYLQKVQCLGKSSSLSSETAPCKEEACGEAKHRLSRWGPFPWSRAAHFSVNLWTIIMFYRAAKLNVIKTPPFILEAVMCLIPPVRHIRSNSWPGMGSYYTSINRALAGKLIKAKENTFRVPSAFIILSFPPKFTFVSSLTVTHLYEQC